MADNIINVGSSGRWQIVVTQTSQDWANNTSLVSVRGIMYKDSSGTAYDAGVTKSVSGTFSWSGSGDFSVPAHGSFVFIDTSFNVPHDVNGYGSANFSVTLGPTGTSTFGSGGSVSTSITLSRIPKRPSVPGTPLASNMLPTSITISWAASLLDNGSAINWYLLRYWDNAEGIDPHINHSFENNLYREVTGLNPGQSYRFRVHAHNSSADNNGYSNSSVDTVVQMIAGAWINDAGGVPRLAIPYVNNAEGIPRMALAYINDAEGIPRLTN